MAAEGDKYGLWVMTNTSDEVTTQVSTAKTMKGLKTHAINGFLVLLQEARDNDPQFTPPTTIVGWEHYARAHCNPSARGNETRLFSYRVHAGDKVEQPWEYRTLYDEARKAFVDLKLNDINGDTLEVVDTIDESDEAEVICEERYTAARGVMVVFLLGFRGDKDEPMPPPSEQNLRISVTIMPGKDAALDFIAAKTAAVLLGYTKAKDEGGMPETHSQWHDMRCVSYGEGDSEMWLDRYDVDVASVDTDVADALRDYEKCFNAARSLAIAVLDDDAAAAAAVVDVPNPTKAFGDAVKFVKEGGDSNNIFGVVDTSGATLMGDVAAGDKTNKAADGEEKEDASFVAVVEPEPPAAETVSTKEKPRKAAKRGRSTSADPTPRRRSRRDYSP